MVMMMQTAATSAVAAAQSCLIPLATATAMAPTPVEWRRQLVARASGAEEEEEEEEEEVVVVVVVVEEESARCAWYLR